MQSGAGYPQKKGKSREPQLALQISYQIGSLWQDLFLVLQHSPQTARLEDARAFPCFSAGLQPAIFSALRRMARSHITRISALPG